MITIIIDGVIGGWDVDSKQIIDQLKDANEDVTIEINSPGGSVMHGVAIFNAIKAFDKGTVTIRITAFAASIASYIALAGDTVEAYDNTTFMIHNASLPVFGDYRALKKGAEISEGLTSIIAKAYIAKTGMDIKTIRDLMDEETFYYGVEMKDAGFIDVIISTESETDQAEALALNIESIKACNNAVNENEKDISIEAVAKLIPQEVTPPSDNPLQPPPVENVAPIPAPEVVDVSAQQQRQRSLQIKEREINKC